MTKRSIPMKGGDEYDAFTTGRQFYHWKPGQLASIKAKFNRRERRETRTRIRKNRGEG
jgi:hypothetical protein